jgi:two-component SAPR family response regulator
MISKEDKKDIKQAFGKKTAEKISSASNDGNWITKNGKRIFIGNDSKDKALKSKLGDKMSKGEAIKKLMKKKNLSESEARKEISVYGIQKALGASMDKSVSEQHKKAGTTPSDGTWTKEGRQWYWKGKNVDKRKTTGSSGFGGRDYS